MIQSRLDPAFRRGSVADQCRDRHHAAIGFVQSRRERELAMRQGPLDSALRHSLQASSTRWPTLTHVSPSPSTGITAPHETRAETALPASRRLDGIRARARPDRSFREQPRPDPIARTRALRRDVGGLRHHDRVVDVFRSRIERRRDSKHARRRPPFSECQLGGADCARSCDGGRRPGGGGGAEVDSVGRMVPGAFRLRRTPRARTRGRHLVVCAGLGVRVHQGLVCPQALGNGSPDEDRTAVPAGHHRVPDHLGADRSVDLDARGRLDLRQPHQDNAVAPVAERPAEQVRVGLGDLSSGFSLRQVGVSVVGFHLSAQWRRHVAARWLP